MAWGLGGAVMTRGWKLTYASPYRYDKGYDATTILRRAGRGTEAARAVSLLLRSASFYTSPRSCPAFSVGVESHMEMDHWIWIGNGLKWGTIWKTKRLWIGLDLGGRPSA